jgi:hypothetical protein
MTLESRDSPSSSIGTVAAIWSPAVRSESREVVWLVPATLRVALLVSADEVELLTRLVSLE